jgi:hypothetical protein
VSCGAWGKIMDNEKRVTHNFPPFTGLPPTDPQAQQQVFKIKHFEKN